MSTLLIPWFKLEPWRIPLPFTLPGGIDEVPIQPFGVLVAIGVLVGAKVAERYGERQGVAPAVINDFITYVVFLGFVCAYFLNAAMYEPEVFLQLFTNPATLFKKYLGLSSFGGFLGAILGILWWRRRRPGESVLIASDATAIGFTVGWAFGRTGCFVVHDHPGKVSDFFLAVDNYQVGYPPYQARHDLGLYEVIWSVATYALFLFLQRKPRPAGFYAAMLPILYTPVRFFLDFLRAPPVEGGDVRYGGWTPGQYAAIALFIFGLLFLRWVMRRDDPALAPRRA